MRIGRVLPVLLIMILLLQAAAFASESVAQGDVLQFGMYEQDDVLQNGAEPIQWVVLDRAGDHLLLLSLYALDAMAFIAGSAYSGWDGSTLRAWLNSEFCEQAFSGAEQAVICPSNHQDDPEWQIPGTADNSDSVFILSLAEAAGYLSKSEERLSVATQHCRNRGAMVCKGTSSYDIEYWFAAWWLRTSGPSLQYAYIVNCYGPLGRFDYVTSDACAVRPAVWVEAEYFESAQGNS